MSNKNYYEILGVPKTATESEIKNAYRSLAMKYHPDRNKSTGSEQKFKEINEAYEVLSDSVKRSHYDRFGSADGPTSGPSFNWGESFSSPFSNMQDFDFDDFKNFSNFDNISDIFGSFFANSWRDTKRNAYKGEDYRTEVTITFEESLHGKTWKENLSYLNDGQKKEVEFVIPAGIKDGQTIALRGYGGKGYESGMNGDLYVKVNVQNHKYFERKGNDVYLEVPVSIISVLTDKTLEVPTPYGRMVLVKVPKVLGPDQTVTIYNQGFPSLKPNEEKGDLKIKFKIYVPHLSQTEIAKISKLFRIGTDKEYKKWLDNFNA